MDSTVCEDVSDVSDMTMCRWASSPRRFEGSTYLYLPCQTVQEEKHRFNPLNAELNPIRHLLALVGARHIVHVSRIRVNSMKINYYKLHVPTFTGLSSTGHKT